MEHGLDIIYIPTSKALGSEWSHSSLDVGGEVSMESPIMCVTSRRALHVTQEGFLTQKQHPHNQNVVTELKELTTQGRCRRFSPPAQDNCSGSCRTGDGSRSASCQSWVSTCNLKSFGNKSTLHIWSEED